MHLRTILAVACFAVASVASAQPPKASPKEPDQLQAREAFLAGKVDEASKLLQAAAKANPSNSPPKVQLSRWFVEARQGEKARLMLEQAAVEEPQHPDVFLTNASFALAEGRITDTILNCSTALSLSEHARWDAESKKRYQREARLGLAAAFERRGDYPSVRTHLVTLLETDPKNATLRQRLATANFLLGKPDDAFAELQAAAKEDPTLDPPQLTMAQLWTVKHDFAKADDWYAKAVAAHPNSAKLHRSLISYSLDRSRFDTAKAHLAAAQKLDPSARETKALSGLVARSTKDYPTATTLFEELVKDHPSFGFGVMNLALTLAESGDTTGKRRATELAEGYATQRPRDGTARAVYAYCLFKAGRIVDADKVARSVEGLTALTPDAAYFVAKVLAERDAVELAHKLVKAATDSKDGFVYRKDAEALLVELDKKLPPKK